MSINYLQRWTFPAFLLVVISAGCESTQGAKWLGYPFVAPADRTYGREEKYRKDYQENRSRQAMQWLITNRVQAGMSVQDVNRILGEDGIREHMDKWLKTGSGNYLIDDVVYHYGPDSEGSSVYLVFRDDKLVNFDPDDFKSGSKSKGKSKRRAKLDSDSAS